MSRADSSAGEDDVVVLVHAADSLNNLVLVIGDDLCALEVNAEVEQERGEEAAVGVLRSQAERSEADSPSQPSVASTFPNFAPEPRLTLVLPLRTSSPMTMQPAVRTTGFPLGTSDSGNWGISAGAALGADMVNGRLEVRRGAVWLRGERWVLMERRRASAIMR